MASTVVKGVRVAAELAGFGNIDAPSGLPGDAGLVWAALECDEAEVKPPGEPTVNERRDTRSSAYDLPGEPETVWFAGARVRRRKGDIVLTCPWRGIGSAAAYTTHAGMPFHMLLNSGMAASAPSSPNDPVAGAVSVTRFTPTVLGEYVAGNGIAAEINSRREFSFVTDAAGPNVVHSPAFSAGLGVAADVRHCQTLYGCIPGVPGPSVALELAGHGWRSYAYGCRMRELKLVLDGRRASWEITMQAPYISDGHSAGVLSVDPVRASGAIAHALGSYVVMTPTVGTTSPAELSRTTLPCDALEFSLVNTITELGYSDTIIGCSDLEIADVKASLGLTLSTTTTTPDRDLYDQTQRSILVGFGPIGAGNGGAIYLPAATLTNDPSARDVGGDTVRQSLRYTAGLWSLDTGSTLPADTNIRIAMCR